MVNQNFSFSIRQSQNAYALYLVKRKKNIISSYSKFLYFSAQLFMVFSVFQASLKTGANACSSKGVISGKYGRWVKTCQPSCNNYQRNLQSSIILLEYSSYFINSGYFSLISSIGIIWSCSCLNWLFWKEFIIKDSLPILYIQHHSLCMKTSIWLMIVCFNYPMTS